MVHLTKLMFLLAVVVLHLATAKTDPPTKTPTAKSVVARDSAKSDLATDFSKLYGPGVLTFTGPDNNAYRLDIDKFDRTKVLTVFKENDYIFEVKKSEVKTGAKYTKLPEYTFQKIKLYAGKTDRQFEENEYLNQPIWVPIDNGKFQYKDSETGKTTTHDFYCKVMTAHFPHKRESKL